MISKHAEIDALNKLHFRIHKKHKITHRDLLVIRMSKTGVLGNAKPCYHCMKRLSSSTFVNIRYIYYSSNNGEIVRERFNDMLLNPTHFISSGFRKRMGLKRCDC